MRKHRILRIQLSRMKQINSNIKKQHIVHPFEPIINAESKVLILGSLPSVKSREQGFYYGHPQNRFWKVISKIFGCEEPRTIDEKRAMLIDHHIAAYDSIYECDIIGSSDSTIENVVATDIAKLIKGTEIGIIYCNGSTSYKYCVKYNKGLNIPIVCLPSSSPANASWSVEALASAWYRVARFVNRSDVKARFYSLNSYVKDEYDMKLYKASLDGGFTCPNRDGKVGTGGCIFCDNEGSGHFTGKILLTDSSDTAQPDNSGLMHFDNSITAQLARGKALVASKLPKNGKSGYIAYFQAYTSTYAPVEHLRKLYEEAISDSEVKILSIATRPDCLGKEVIDLLKDIAARIPVWVELGLQTSKPESVDFINRCYENKVYVKAINDLRKAGIKHIITHVILGLPYETTEDMIDSVRYACEGGTDGIKLQLLHVLKGTALADIYSRSEFKVLSLEEYSDIVSKALDIIPPDVVVHRITGDGDKNKLIAPIWSGDKKRVLNYMNAFLDRDLKNEKTKQSK